MFSLEKTLSDAWPPADWQDVTVLVAVSGGADSMALLSALVRLKTGGAGRLIAGHFNHRLRGAASDADAEFVRQTCRQLGVPLEKGQATAVLESGESGSDGGIEERARAARYEFLTTTAARLGARYVVTAHTADDQVETILQRIIRGTGLAGLAGIPFARRLSEATTVVRPMLSITRANVLEYLTAVDLEYRDDASNADLSFMRNRIRHELLPLLRDRYHPAVKESLLRLGQLANEARRAMVPQVLDLYEQAVTKTTVGFSIARAPLLKRPPHLVREVLMFAWHEQMWPEQDMGYATWDSLAQLLLAEVIGERRTLPGGIDVKREASGLRFQKM